MSLVTAWSASPPIVQTSLSGVGPVAQAIVLFFAESRIVPLPYASASVSVPIDRPLLELQTSPVRVWQTDAFVTFNGPKNELPAALFSCSKRSAFVVYVMETSMQRWCGVLVARLRWRG